MNWLLGVVVLGCLGVVLVLLWMQIRADREFLEYLERRDR